MVFEKVVNEDVILEKRDEKHLFFESDFPKSWRKATLFEARNCYISIELVPDIEEFTEDKDTIKRLKNKNVYFVQFAKTIDILFKIKGTVVVDGVYENFIDDMEGAIEYLNAYLIEEARN